MTYLEHQLPAPLNKYINKLWYVKLENSHKMEKIFPQPYVHLIFNLSDRYKLFEDTSLHKWETIKQTFLSGIQQQFLLVENPKLIENIGIEFKPHGLNQFFNISLTKVTNKVTDINRIDGVRELHEKLKNGEPEDKFKLIEEFLLTNFKNKQGEYTTVNKVIEAIEINPDVNLDEVAKPLNLSKKHLTQMFKNYTGTTIINLANIYKFNKVIKSIQENPDANWIEIASLNNYYDQAYFSKVFKHYTGFTPSEYTDAIHKFKQNPTNFVKIKHR